VWDLAWLGLALVLLLALNGFFVLAEFAIVKVRPTRVSELVSSGSARASMLQGIQSHLDDYLSVCQVGITLASVALGMVGKNAADTIMGPDKNDVMRYALAMGFSYIMVSGSHILLGELVPKSAAIRVSERAALWCSPPLRFFHTLFLPALWLLTKMANAILKLVGLGGLTGEEEHTEEELRIILDRSQEHGMMSFRRLLFLENVFDFGDLTVRDAMRPRGSVACLDVRLPWSENLRRLRTSRFTRYPLVPADGVTPTGFIHVKDLLVRDGMGEPDLEKMVHPLVVTREGTLLETLLSEMQRRRLHAAVVLDDAGQWAGFLTLEDVIEELVGTIRDEFEEEEPVRLCDTLTESRIQLDVEADSPVAAVRLALSRLPAADLPLPAERILQAIEAREKVVGTYLGEGVGMPHARVPGLEKAFAMVLRSHKGIPCHGTSEKGRLLFVLLTPAGQPRVHQRLQAIIATLLQESEYVKERLLTADTPAEVLEVIRAGEQAALG
jgi:CBS domain containing-hemolysin-like protein